MTEPTKPNTTLVGLWVLIPAEGDYSLTGQVMMSIGNYHLVKIYPPENGVPIFSQLMTSDDLCRKETFFFSSRSEVEAWLRWHPTDDGGPRVVAMRKA
jgi:hypothetical protein